VRVSSGKFAALAALALAGVVSAGCSKKSDYGTDTSAAAMTRTDTTSFTASSTAPATQDTTASTSASTSKTSVRKTTTKKTTTKKSY